MREDKPTNARIWLILALIFLGLAIVLAIALAFVSAGLHGGETTQPCPSGLEINTRATELTPFSDLTLQEITAIRDYMTSHETLGVKPMDIAFVNNSYIFHIDLHIPSKGEVLAFLDSNGKKPSREAKVVVIRGDAQPPKVEEYIVSPTDKPRSHRKVNNPSYSKDPIPYHSRPFDFLEEKKLEEMLKETTKKAYKILKESYGMGYHNCTETGPCLLMWATAPRGTKSGQRRSWHITYRLVDGFYLHPVGFQVLVNHEGPDTSKWRVEKVFYNSQIFSSVEELVRGYDDGRVKKVKLPDIDPNVPSYSSFEQRGKPNSDKPRRSPKQYEPDGKRYSVNGRHVEYLGWSFDWRIHAMTGVQFFDIRFNKERVIYEMGLQEASALYSGWNPWQGTSNYFDASWLMGSNLYELEPGLDCPEYATFFDHIYLVNRQEPNKGRRAVCIFEMTTSRPLRRHHATWSKTYQFHGGMEDSVLVVRYIPVTWNYDYIFDYIFHQDGTMEVKTSLTGYVQSTFYSPQELKYGHKIHDNVVATMHQHLFNYKVDLDILGTENRFATLDIELEAIAHPWYLNETKKQKTFVHRLKTTEKEAAYKYNFDTPKYLLVYNENKKNKWGTKRAYKIKNIGVSKKMDPDDYAYEKAASWARYQAAVTRQKDSEEGSSSIYAQSDPFDPVVSFQSYIDDNENIVDKDLVVWVTMGTHHIPHSEDVPSTTTTGASLMFYLQPYNYFDNDPSVASYDNIVIKPTNDFHGYSIKQRHEFSEPTCSPRSGTFHYNGTMWL